MNSIYKCYDGTYIDLERVVAIRKQSFDQICIYFQLMKEPVILHRWDENGFSLLGSIGVELDKLISVWNKYKKND